MLRQNDQKENVLQSESRMVRGQFFRLLPYQVLLIVITAVNGIADSVVASNYIGNSAMTAIGMFGPVNHFLYAISIMLVSGSVILCGQYMGRNQTGELRNVFSVNLVFSLGISLLLSLAMGLSASFNLTAGLVASPEDAEALKAYFIGQALGIPGLVLGQQLFSFLSLENKTRLTMAATLACVLVNVGLDLLFVNVLNMGTFGLALATSVSEWVFFAIMALYYVFGKTMIRFSLHDLRFKEVGTMIQLGYPGSISRFVEMFRCVIVNALIMKFVGSTGMSSFAASNSVMAIFWALPFGMMAVARMLLSISVGAEDRSGTIVNMSVTLRWGLLLICCVTAAVIALAEPFTRLFFHDPSEPVYGMTVMALRILPLCMIFSTVSLIFCCYYQVIQKKVCSILLPILDGMLFVVLLSLVLIPAMGMNGLYLANVLNGVLCLAAIVLFSVAARKRIPRNLEELMAMPESFGAGENDILDFAVRNMEDVVEVAGQVEEFCLSRGVDSRRAVLSGLALEEMAGNVVKHGFRKSSGKRRLDIRVTVKDGEVIMRVRDDCAVFNPNEKLKFLQQTDDKANREIGEAVSEASKVSYYTGIRLASGISKEMNYDNILGLNVLLLRI